MSLNDKTWEKRLGIRTGAADYEHEDDHHSRYEPTGYAVLDRLAGSGYISKEDVLVDYGCGKGRVGFFLNHVLGCRTIGIEYDEAIYLGAMENLSNYNRKTSDRNGVSFLCCSAENYLPDGANSFYFFNPFSEKILRSVLGRILESYYADPREMRLFFYYALDSYLSCLMTEENLSFVDEIDCQDLFHNADPREKIRIFRIG
jgi:SAM-dependent methyltransferase